MRSDYLYEYWIREQEEEANLSTPPEQLMNQGNPVPEEMPEDISQDPEVPDIDDEIQDKEEDFQVWKRNFFKESIKGNPNELINLIGQVRDRDLKPDDRRFVENNLQIQFLRLGSNILAASKEIRQNVNDQLDHNNPGSSLVGFLSQALQKQLLLSNNFIKINGYGGMKGDIHRKYIGSLLGAVQVGNGANLPDLALEDNDYSVMISTRMNSTFGMIDVGRWFLHEGDAERYLEEPERQKLEQGSPQERDVLRKRIIMESIANMFKNRCFLITVLGMDGTVYHIGWDIETCIKSGYLDGKLIIKTSISKESEAMIDSNGSIISLMDIEVKYTVDTGELDEDGQPLLKEASFMSRENGMLYLTATLDTLKDATQKLQGLTIKPIAYVGNPSDLMSMNRCVYNVSELINRICR